MPKKSLASTVERVTEIVGNVTSLELLNLTVPEVRCTSSLFSYMS